MILGLLLTLALTGLPRLMVTLALQYDSQGSYGTLGAPRPLFFDKVSGSQFTLARPEDSALPWARRVEAESAEFVSGASEPLDPMPRWQRTLITTAFWHHSKFV